MFDFALKAIICLCFILAMIVIIVSLAIIDTFFFRIDYVLPIVMIVFLSTWIGCALILFLDSIFKIKGEKYSN